MFGVRDRRSSDDPEEHQESGDDIVVQRDDGDIVVKQGEDKHYKRFATMKGGIIVAVLLVMVISYQYEWRFIKWSSVSLWNWGREWVPSHPKSMVAVGVYFALAYAVGYVVHSYNIKNKRKDRTKSWLTFSTVLALIWPLFWYWPLVVTFRHVLGTEMQPMAWHLILFTGIAGIVIASATFWIGEYVEDVRFRFGWVNNSKKEGHSVIRSIFILLFNAACLALVTYLIIKVIIAYTR